MGPPLVGISQSIVRIRELIDHVADTGLNIVISGETGVGKEVVAQNLYQKSSRSGKPFLKINCASLPEGLLESELYGYERGAFTGAERKKKGKFELAHGGVLFLDEIGDMPIMLQSKLLHVLQSGEFSPLGSEKELKTDTWIIAATNQDLEKAIHNKSFREDLYYRLNIIKIVIPPLRERPEDIFTLIEYYFKLYNTKFNLQQAQLPDKTITDRLSSYHWPGNVRQLQNVIKKFLVIGNWNEIIDELKYSADLYSAEAASCEAPNAMQTIASTKPPTIIRNELEDAFEADPKAFSLKSIRKKTIDKVEKEAISLVLKKTGWNRTKASKILQISYKTLLTKISELNIEPDP